MNNFPQPTIAYEGDEFYVPHVWFRLDLTGWCDHCGAEYVPQLPATLEAIAAEHEAFMREHEHCEAGQ